VVTAAGLGTETLVVVAAVVLFGGLVKGTAGFGYAVASTAVLATLVAPTVAVTLMIVPTLAANLSLARELGRDGLRSCVRRFWPYVLAATVGTLVGTALLDVVPTRPLSGLLGAFTLGYALLNQRRLPVPGRARLGEFCVEDPSTSAAVGLVSGVVFGASNVAVQVVAYVDALDLDRETFVGVLSMVLVGVSTVRVGAAAGLGLYTPDLFALSLLAAVPGLLGVAAGERLRARLPEAAVSAGVLAVLVVVGLRLLARAAGV
jgi:uncharacterized membrane protein YfcA